MLAQEAGARPCFGSHCDPGLARSTCGLDVVGAMSTLGSMTKKAESTHAAEAAVAAHYGMLLGIQSPWQVKRVELKLEAKRVDVELGHDASAAVACPECGRACGTTTPRSGNGGTWMSCNS